MAKGPLKTTINIRRMSSSIMAGAALGEDYLRLAGKLNMLEDFRRRYVGTEAVDYWINSAVEAVAKRVVRDCVEARSKD